MMKTGVDRTAAETRANLTKSLAPHLKQTGRAYRPSGTAPQIGSVRNERNRFFGFIDINNHPIDAGIKNSYLFTFRSDYISSIMIRLDVALFLSLISTQGSVKQ
jgi:hypothetical protein